MMINLKQKSKIAHEKQKNFQAIKDEKTINIIIS
jgi:hypothetical protein